MANYVTRKTHNAKVKELQERIEELEEKLSSEIARRPYAVEKHEAAMNALHAEETRRNSIVDGIKMAHNTLHQVNADENNTALLVRVVGNVQGLLQAMLMKANADKSKNYMHDYAPPLRVYDRPKIMQPMQCRSRLYRED